MNNRLYQASILAIPLKKDENFEGIQPNYMVINSFYNRLENMPYKEVSTGNIVKGTVTEVNFDFVYRIEWSSDKALQELKFPSRKPIEYLPITFLALLDNYETLLSQKNIINGILSLFEFIDGNILNGLVLSLDEDKCLEIITDKENRKMVAVIQQLVYKEDIDEYLLTVGKTLEDFSEYSLGYENKPNKPIVE